jgi:hypothetical protein
MLSRKLRDEYSNRLFVPLFITVLMLFFGYVLEYDRRQIQLMDYVGLEEYVGRPFLETMIALSVEDSITFITSTVRLVLILFPIALFNALPALVALVVPLWLGSHFIRSLYDADNLREAAKFLNRNVLGMRGLRPVMIIKEGHVAVGAGSFYDRTGGRGLLIVYNDSAAVLEKGGQLTRVVGPSLTLLKPFERVWGVVDLRHQRWPLTVNAMTKDGIPISCDVNVTFKIDDRFIDETGSVRVKSPLKTNPESVTDDAIAEELRKAGIAKPLPYTEEAVFRAATSNWIRIRQQDHQEQLRRWTGQVVIGGVEGTLRNILADYRLDWLLQSPQPDRDEPRREILRELERQLEKAFCVGNSVGARILDVELGQIEVRDVENEAGEKIEVPNEVYTQWIEAWQANWQQRTAEKQMEGEAELARLQAAQMQAQAEMALTLTESIRPLVADGEEASSYLLATRFIETLHWMAYDPWKRAFMPPEIMRTLDELEKVLGQAYRPPSGKSANKAA